MLENISLKNNGYVQTNWFIILYAFLNLSQIYARPNKERLFIR